jgi:hypothetical protein
MSIWDTIAWGVRVDESALHDALIQRVMLHQMRHCMRRCGTNAAIFCGDFAEAPRNGGLDASGPRTHARPWRPVEDADLRYC